MYSGKVRKVVYVLIGEDGQEYKIEMLNHLSTVEQIKNAARLKFNQFMKSVIDEKIIWSKKPVKGEIEKRRKGKDKRKWTTAGYHKWIKRKGIA